MTAHQSRSRVPAGVTTGGQFATEARSEAPVVLGYGPPRATVTVEGVQGPNASTYADALAHVLPLKDALMQVRVDEPGGRFSATVHARGYEYRIDSADGEHVRLKRADGPYLSDQFGRMPIVGNIESMVVGAHRACIARDTLDNVGRMVREEHSTELVRMHPATLRREASWSGVTELGFGLPGDHIKVRVFGEDTDGTGIDARAAGELFCYSSVKDRDSGDLTERQRRNRLNKVLDAIGPDRAYAERYLRRYLALARAEMDTRHAADPILAGDTR